MQYKWRSGRLAQSSRERERERAQARGRGTVAQKWIPLMWVLGRDRRDGKCQKRVHVAGVCNALMWTAAFIRFICFFSLGYNLYLRHVRFPHLFLRPITYLHRIGVSSGCGTKFHFAKAMYFRKYWKKYNEDTEFKELSSVHYSFLVPSALPNWAPFQIGILPMRNFRHKTKEVSW